MQLDTGAARGDHELHRAGHTSCAHHHACGFGWVVKGGGCFICGGPHLQRDCKKGKGKGKDGCCGRQRSLSLEGVSQMDSILPERLLALVRPAFDLVLRRIRSLKRCVQACGCKIMTPRYACKMPSSCVSARRAKKTGKKRKPSQTSQKASQEPNQTSQKASQEPNQTSQKASRSQTKPARKPARSQQARKPARSQTKPARKPARSQPARKPVRSQTKPARKPARSQTKPARKPAGAKPSQPESQPGANKPESQPEAKPNQPESQPGAKPNQPESQPEAKPNQPQSQPQSQPEAKPSQPEANQKSQLAETKAAAGHFAKPNI